MPVIIRQDLLPEHIAEIVNCEEIRVAPGHAVVRMPEVTITYVDDIFGARPLDEGERATLTNDDTAALIEMPDREAFLVMHPSRLSTLQKQVFGGKKRSK
jgi:hypothetical protein